MSTNESLPLSSKRLILADYVNNKTEVEFMKEVLDPVFEKMGFKVIYNHGPDELGKDFVLSKLNDFEEEEITCVVVKNGDITGSSSGSSSISEIKRQVDTSLTTTLDEFGLKGRLPNKVMVVTSGKITSQARRTISQNSDSLNSTKVSLYWNEQLIPLIDKYYPLLFQVALPTTARYLADLIDYIESITTIDHSFSNLINFANLKCIKETKAATESKRVTCSPDDIPKAGGFSWIQGGTGSGKTFTVYRMAERAMSVLKAGVVRKSGTENKDIHIPIYLKASSLSFDIKTFSLENFLYESLKKYSSSCSLSDVNEWINNFNIIVVIDEYEFKTPQVQLEHLSKEILRFPQMDLLVLSRILSESQLKFERTPEVWRMRELNLASARKILYSCIPSENKKGVQLYNDMLNNGVLERVPKTPLALNVLSQVFSGNVNSTPVNMFEFFDMFFELILGRWEPKRDLESPLDYNQVRGFLQEVAYQMVSENKLTIPIMFLIPLAEKILRSTRNSSMSAQEFIEAVARYGEVAVIRENEFLFTQRTFMEFLAGCEFEKYHWDNEFIKSKITDLNWEDCLIFAAGSKKKDDHLLSDISSIPESNASQLFFKTKNIAALVLALYRSDNQKRLSALFEGIKAAVKLRDNSNFELSIKSALRDDRDITVSLVSLSIFSTFYGKNGLADLLKDALRLSDSDREKFYILSAVLETLELNTDFTELLPLVPQDVSSKEGLAFGPYIQFESNESEKSEPIKSLLKEKEIKKIAEKSIGILRDQRREKTKFIPTTKK